ncbi:MAG: Holliday junction resolvase RuvX [Dysgonomonas sp.]
MGRLLAIDYGTKRTGIAVSDTLKIIANGLTTVATHTLIDFLKSYLQKESVDCIIVGMPKQMNNEYSDNMKHIVPFVKKLQGLYPDLKIEYYDERFTSVLAHQAMLDGGLKKKDRQNKALVDEISATIILQDYMESLRLKQI